MITWMLVVLLGLAEASSAEIRARDPGEEDEPHFLPARPSWERVLNPYRTGPGSANPPPTHQQNGDEEEVGETAPPSGEAGMQRYPARNGNWCAFVHRKAVTVAVACGTEKYIIRSQSPCPNGTPDCQLVMYKLSTRPVYREKQKVFTALLWKCCDGYEGQSCESRVADDHVSDTSGPHPGLPGPSGVPGGQRATRDRITRLPSRQIGEQNDFHLNNRPHEEDARIISVAHPDLEDDYDPDHIKDERDFDHDHMHHQVHNISHHPMGYQDHDHNRASHQDQERDYAGRRDQEHGHVSYQDHERNHANHQDNDNDHEGHQDPENGRSGHQGHDQGLARHQERGYAGSQDQERVHAGSQDQERGHAGSQDHEYDGVKHHDRPHVSRQEPHHGSDPGEQPDHDHFHEHVSHHHDDDHSHQGHQDHVHHSGPQVTLSFPESTELPVPHIVQMLMMRLQPVLDGFNQSLQSLSEEVRHLSRDVSQLRQDPPSQQEEIFHTRLEESFQQIGQLRALLSSKQEEMEQMVHTQQAAMHYNLSSIKVDVDNKIKRHQKTMQGSLHSLNASVAEVRLGQEQLEEELMRDGRSPENPPEGAAAWEAIRRLDNKVVNNTVKVSALLENMEQVSDNIRDLQRGFRRLEDHIAETDRKSQVRFMETGLEVEDYKVTVLERVSELAGNLTLHDVQLREMESDMDYLYQQIYRNVSKPCNCQALKTSLAILQKQLDNITELANDNKLAIDATLENVGHWGGGASVDELRASILQELQALEQEEMRSLQQNVSLLHAELESSRAKESAPQERDSKQQDDMEQLFDYFDSLKQDVIRQSEVLELFLGEEVMEFKVRSLHDREEFSIQALRKKLDSLASLGCDCSEQEDTRRALHQHLRHFHSLFGDTQGMEPLDLELLRTLLHKEGRKMERRHKEKREQPRHTGDRNHQ